MQDVADSDVLSWWVFDNEPGPYIIRDMGIELMRRQVYFTPSTIKQFTTWFTFWGSGMPQLNIFTLVLWRGEIRPSSEMAGPFLKYQHENADYLNQNNGE